MENVKELLKEHGPEKTFDLAREKAKEYIYNLKSQGKISFSNSIKGEVPSVHVIGDTLPSVWEDMSMAIIGIGNPEHTHYDPGFEEGNFTSFPSLEVTGMMHIHKPQGEPRFHKHFLTGQFGDYVAEIEGVKDHWVLDPSIVADSLKQGLFEEIKDHKGWLYSYSQRIRKYPFLDIEAKSQTINQLESVIKNLSKNPLSRSAQVTTWDPRFDQNDGQMKYRELYGKDLEKAIFNEYHAPCLQRIHFRLTPHEGGYKLNTNTHWRSRDHPKAVPHNIFGIIEGLIEPQRKELEKALNAPISLGRYVDISDSLHVYGHYLDPRMQGLDAEAYLQDVFRIANGEPIEDRVITPGTPIHEMTLEGIEEEYKARVENPDLGRD